MKPSGKLPVQIPRQPGGQPGTYLQPPLGGGTPASATSTPPRCSPSATAHLHMLRARRPAGQRDEVPTDGEFAVPVRVRNTGSRAGAEVVQLYLHDVLAAGRPAGKAARRVCPCEAGAGEGGTYGSGCTPIAPLTRRVAPHRRAGRGQGARRHLRGDLPCRAEDTVDRGELASWGRTAGSDPGRRQPAAASATRKGACLPRRRQSGSCHAGHGRGLGGRLRRDRLQGGQRPSRRRGATRARRVPAPGARYMGRPAGRRATASRRSN